MKSISFFTILFIMLSFSSCAKCNKCTINTDVQEICTNSLLDRAKAKSVCKKEGGVWEKTERQ
ncbi:MAG: hypothetical protein ACPGVH_06905 [Chitinophagales bacterium]